MTPNNKLQANQALRKQKLFRKPDPLFHVQTEVHFVVLYLSFSTSIYTGKCGGWCNPRWVTSVSGSWPSQYHLPHFPQFRLQPQSSNKTWIVSQKYTNTAQIVYEYFQSSSHNTWIYQSSTPLLAEICNYKMNFICNLIHVLLTGKGDVTLNHCKRRWVTALTQMNLEYNWDDIKFFLG